MDFDRLIQQVRWQYAVTYPTAPHEYTVFDWYRDDSVVLGRLRQFACCIESEGIVSRFGNTEYRYFSLGEFKYWIMDSAEHCTLINRTYVDDSRCREIVDAMRRGQVIARNGDSLSCLACKLSLLAKTSKEWESND